jgi:O-antigen ligase
LIEQNNRFPISINQLTAAVFSVFFILLPVIFSNQVIETASLPRHILITSVACILLFILALQFLLSNKTKLSFSKIHLALFAFYCWALLSILWSLDIIAFFASQLHSNNQIKQIMCAIYFGAAIAAAIGILQAFNFNPLELKMSTLLASTFNNKNYAAVYFDLVIPLALITMLTTTSYTKYISSIAYTLALTFILLSKTKGSILGYIVFSLFFLFFIYKNKSIQQQLFQKKKIIQYIALSFIIPISIYSLTNIKLINVVETSTPISWKADLTKNSVSVRLSLYKNAYAMLKEDPLTGVGYGAFRKGFAPYASSPHIVTSITEDRAIARLHNDPYQNLLELGIIGAGLIIIIFSYILYKCIYTLSTKKLENNDRINRSEYLLLGSFLALISSISHSFVDFPMRLPSSAALFWFISGLTILLLNKTSKNDLTKNYQCKRTQGIVLFIFCILLSIQSIDLYQRLFPASKLQYDATVLMLKNKDNCPTTKDKIDQALNIFFESYSIRHRYAQIYSYCDLSPEIKLAAMDRVLNYDSSHTRARLTRGIINLENKKFLQARIDFEKLIKILPHRPSAYLGLGDIATLTKDFKSARKYYEKAKTLEPTNQKADFMLKQFEEKGI